MSCSRLLYRLVRWARESSSLYGELKSQYTALSPRSWTRSSFLLSELLQKCHASPQYVKYGSMAALYILNLASTGINFRILISTPTRMLAFLPDADMCSVKDKSLSITTPSNSSSSVDLIILESILTSSCWEPLDMTIAWYLLRFPTRKLSLYQPDVSLPSGSFSFSSEPSDQQRKSSHLRNQKQLRRTNTRPQRPSLLRTCRQFL